MISVLSLKSVDWLVKSGPISNTLIKGQVNALRAFPWNKFLLYTWSIRMLRSKGRLISEGFIAILLFACGSEKSAKNGSVPTNRDEAFSLSAWGQKQQECNSKGVILDLVADPKTCDTMAVASWPCSRGGLANRLAALNPAADNSAFLTRVDDTIKSSFEVDQCGELSHDGQTSIKVIFVKKEFDGSTFQGSSQRVQLDVSPAGQPSSPSQPQEGLHNKLTGQLPSTPGLIWEANTTTCDKVVTHDGDWYVNCAGVDVTIPMPTISNKRSINTVTLVYQCESLFTIPAELYIGSNYKSNGWGPNTSSPTNIESTVEVGETPVIAIKFTPAMDDAIKPGCKIELKENSAKPFNQ
jgi:hypothetical protein